MLAPKKRIGSTIEIRTCRSLPLMLRVGKRTATVSDRCDHFLHAWGGLASAKARQSRETATRCVCGQAFGELARRRRGDKGRITGQQDIELIDSQGHSDVANMVMPMMLAWRKSSQFDTHKKSEANQQVSDFHTSEGSVNGALTERH